MVDSHHVQRLAGVAMLFGGLLLFSSSDFAVFPYGLLLCALGSSLVCWRAAREHAAWHTRIAALSLAGAVFGALVGMVGQALPLVVWTRTRYGEAGNVIDVINYPLSYVTDRCGSILAFLLLGVGLWLLAPNERITASQVWGERVFRMLAVASLLIFGVGVVDVYLDGETPGVLVSLVWRLFAAGWVGLGMLLFQTAKLPLRAMPAKSR